MTAQTSLIRPRTALAVVFGLPGAKTKAAAEALQTIGEAAPQSCSIVPIDSLDDWKKACSVGTPFIAISQYPSPEIRAHFEDQAIPALIILDDLSNAAAEMIDDLQSETRAVRAISASASCLAEMFRQDAATIRASNTRNMNLFLMSLAAANGIPVSHHDLNDMEAHVSKLSSRFDLREPRRKDPRASDRLWQAAFLQMSHGRVHWPDPLFLRAGLADALMQGPIELVGPARCLLYGPYMHLPSGRWEAKMIIALAGDVGAQSFSVEVVCNEAIAGGRFSCRGPGTIEVRIDFSHRDPHVAIEIRVFMDAGAIYGSLKSFDVELSLLDRAARRVRPMFDDHKSLETLAMQARCSKIPLLR